MELEGLRTFCFYMGWITTAVSFPVVFHQAQRSAWDPTHMYLKLIYLELMGIAFLICSR